MNVNVKVKGGRGRPSLNHLAPAERGPTEELECRAGRFKLETVSLQRQRYPVHIHDEGCPLEVRGYKRIMSLHRSLRSGGATAAKRNVLKRGERVALLK